MFRRPPRSGRVSRLGVLGAPEALEAASSRQPAECRTYSEFANRCGTDLAEHTACDKRPPRPCKTLESSACLVSQSTNRVRRCPRRLRVGEGPSPFLACSPSRNPLIGPELQTGARYRVTNVRADRIIRSCIQASLVLQRCPPRRFLVLRSKISRRSSSSFCFMISLYAVSASLSACVLPAVTMNPSSFGRSSTTE